MDVNIKEYLKSLGCKDLVKISLAFHLYLELTEVRKMFDVEFVYSEELEILYLTAKPSMDSCVQIYVPFSASLCVSMEDIDKLQHMLCSEEQDYCITLACIEGDSTIVLYTFNSGLVPVKNPDCLVRQKTREERRDFIEGEIKKKKYQILSKAYEHLLHLE